MATTVTLPYAYSPINPANNPVLSTPVTLVNPDGTPGGGVATTVDLDQTTPGTTNGVAVSYIGSNSVLTGNGVTGTGSLRVTIASDQTAFSVNSTSTGNVASGASDSGNPVKVGGVFNTTLPTVTNGQRVDSQLTNRGIMLVNLADANGGVTGVNATGADGVNNANGAVLAISRGNLYNGTTWDRSRSIAASFGNAIGVQAVETAGSSYSHISTSTTTTVKSGAGILHKVVVNTLGTVASTTTIYDNTAGSGTVIGVINTLNLSGPFAYDLSFATGLTIVTTGTVAPDITVVYR